MSNQVKDWMDSFWHKSEDIPIERISGLTAILNNLPPGATVNIIVAALSGVQQNFNADGSFSVAAGNKLTELFVKPSGAVTLQIGTTPGGNEVAADIELTDTGGESIFLNRQVPVDTTFYISGVTVPIQTKRYITPTL